MSNQLMNSVNVMKTLKLFTEKFNGFKELPRQEEMK